eukprot:2116233-Prymnesium_polylepis.3
MGVERQLAARNVHSAGADRCAHTELQKVITCLSRANHKDRCAHTELQRELHVGETACVVCVWCAARGWRARGKGQARCLRRCTRVKCATRVEGEGQGVGGAFAAVQSERPSRRAERRGELRAAGPGHVNARA